MRIAVCIGEVPDASGAVVLDEALPTLSDQRFVYAADPAALSAIALAKTIPESEITAFLIGGEKANYVLRAALAAGAEYAVRIEDKALETATESGAARALAAAVKDFDLVFTGTEAGGLNSGYMGAAMAEYLNWPQISNVTELTVEEGLLTAQRRLQRGDRETLQCPLPAVLTVSEGSGSPANPSLKQKLKAAKAAIAEVDLAGLNLAEEGIRAPQDSGVLSYNPPRPRTKRSSAPRGVVMVGAGGAGKNLFEGDPKKAAEEILKKL